MLYTTGTEYAIRALTLLALRPSDRMTQLGDITESDELPQAFLAKILNQLVQAGLLRSARGPGGGYALARPAADISLLEIRAALDGNADLNECAVGLEPCTDETPCPLHEAFKPLRHAIRAYLEETSLEDLAHALGAKRSAHPA